MIIASAKKTLDLYKQVFMEVYDLPDLTGDPRNYKDTPAILTLKNYQPATSVNLNENGFYSTFDYDKYIVGGNDLMKVEINHYNKEYVQSGKIENLIKFFKFDGYTRRAVLCLWDNPNLDLSKPFPCTVYVWFRVINGKLNMNYHMRANDAYKILLMDTHIAVALHVYVSKLLSLGIGEYNHIVDSLHFYKEHKKEIKNLYETLKTR